MVFLSLLLITKICKNEIYSEVNLTKFLSFIWCAVCSLHECPKLLQNCNRKWICVLLELVIQSRSGTTKLDIFDILMKT